MFVGTAADNVADRDRKGRGVRGERAGRAKLTSDEVIEIRNTPYGYRVVQRLAKRFGVSAHTILDLRHKHRNWKHIL